MNVANLRARLARAGSSSGARALMGTVLGSAPGFALPFILTSHFGIGRLTDAYFYAFALAALLGVLASVVLEANVLPAATIVARGGSRRLTAYVLRIALRASLLALGGYVLAGGIGLFTIHAQGSWTSSQKHLAVELLAIFGLYVVLLASTGTLAGALYAVGDFLTPTLSQSLRAIVPIAILPLTSVSSTGVLVSAGALCAGEACRLLLMLWLLWRRSDEPAASTAPEPPAIWRAALPHAISLGIVGLNPVIDRMVAATLASGSVTLIDLGEKILAVPVLAITSSVILVGGARWAKLAADDDPSLRHDVVRTSRRAFALATGMALVILAGVGLSMLLLPDTVAGLPVTDIGKVVACLMVGLPASALVNCGARVLTTLRETRILPLLAVSAIVVNTAGDIAGAALLGVEGIALATSLVKWVNAGIYLVVCRRLLTPA
jgi:peptidoglycan biosynthesis protein MviN/MurJ (putative lipid II flippase)